MKRLNPSLILALTATPTPKRTNVLCHVSAQQLQAEHRIKLPITLIERPRGWQAAVFDAVQNQRPLEALAQQEEAQAGPNQGSYLRPIVLLQAQNSSDPVNVDVLRAHLTDELRIPADQVVVATAAAFDLPALAVELPSGKALPPLVQDAVTQGVTTLSTDGVRLPPPPGYRMP